MPTGIPRNISPSLLLLSLLAMPLEAQTAAGPNPVVPASAPAPVTVPGIPSQESVPQPLQIPTTQPIPTTAPPTGLQAALPRPIGSLPKSDHPARVSPNLGQLTGNVPPQPLNINDAVAIALINNRQLALATIALLRAQGRLSETRAAFSPTLSGSFTYTRLNQGQSAVFGGTPSGTTTTTMTTTGSGGATTGGTTTTGTGTGTTGSTGGTGVQTGGTGTTGSTTTTSGTGTTGGQVITLSNADQPILSGSLSLPIDIAGLLRAAERQAQFLEVAQRIDINRTRNQIVLDTKSAFYNVLRAQALVVVAQETLRNSQDRLLDAQRKYAAGTVAQFDVIRALTDVQNARQQLIVAQTNVDNSLGILNSNMGLNIDTALSITSQGAVVDPPGVAPPAITLDATGQPVPLNLPAGETVLNDANLPPATGVTGTRRESVIVAPSNVLGPEYHAVVQEATQNRPEILEADAQIAAARKGIQLARRSLSPVLNLSANIQHAPNAAGFSPQTTTESYVLAVSFPLYDGGTANARTTQARADVATAEVNRRQAIDNVNLEVRQAYLSLLQARDRVAVANQALSEALESYRLARVRYTNGVSTLVEISDAQNALTQAENNQVNALYDYNNARSTLDKSAGRYAYQGNAAGYSAPPSPKITGATGSTGSTGNRGH